MKKIFYKSMSWILSVMMLFGTLMFSEIASVKVKAANTAESLISIAEGELGSTNYSKYYGGNKGAWCADFVSWCAQQAGVDSIALSSSCYYMYRGMIDNGCQEVTEPQRGDIVFFYCTSCSSTADKWCHVGIMVDSTTSIDGNYSGKVSYDSSYSHYGSLGYKHSESITKKYVRPKYEGNNNFPGAEDTSYAVPYSEYATHRCDTYNSGGNKESGHYIAEGDYCYIDAVYENGFCHVEYDIDGGGRRWAYALAGDFNIPKKENKCDIGTNFYAYIINSSAWKMATVVGNNVQLESETGKPNQVWYFERQDDLYYKITNVGSNGCLDVDNFGDTNGTNIQSYGSNDSSAQRWCFVEHNGVHVLHPKCAPSMALDVNGGSTNDGANIQLWETNGTSAQDFNIYKLNKPDATALYVFEGNQYKPTRFSWTKTNNTTHYNLKIYKDKIWDGELVIETGSLKDEFYSANLPEGYYEAYIDSCNNYSWTMSTNVVKFTITEGTPKIIDTDFYAYIVNTASDSYIINDKNSNACFNKTSETEENQKVWYFTKNDNDSFTIKSMYDNKVLDVYMEKDENGTNVQTYNQGENQGVNYANQQWYFQGVAPYYYIKPAFTGRVLDLNGGKYYDNVNAQVWEKNGTDAQKFKLIKVNYSISYDMNGGTGKIDIQTKNYNQELALSNTKPTKTGYTFAGWSTDKNSAQAVYQPGDKYTNNQDLTLYAVWEKIPELRNNTSVSKTKFNIGETITVKGAASGGTGPYTYEFYYKRSTADSWTKFDKNGVGTFKPGSAGTFTIKTYVKDSTGKASVKEFTLTATNAPLTNNTTVTKTNFNVGETITVKGAAEGGKAPYTYEFYYKRSTSSSWTKFGKDGSGTFKPGSAGTFAIKTYVKDSNGKASVKEFTLTAS